MHCKKVLSSLLIAGIVAGNLVITPVSAASNTITKYYNKATTCTFKDTKGIKKITINGKNAKIKVGVKSKRIKFSKQGKYTVKMTGRKGTKKSYVIYIDKTKPVISGVKSGATYDDSVTVRFSDNYAIKSVKENGKSIKVTKTKSFSKVYKTVGSYNLTITDKAGNKRTVKFTVQNKNIPTSTPTSSAISGSTITPTTTKPGQSPSISPSTIPTENPINNIIVENSSTIIKDGKMQTVIIISKGNEKQTISVDGLYVLKKGDVISIDDGKIIATRDDQKIYEINIPKETTVPTQVPTGNPTENPTQVPTEKPIQKPTDVPVVVLTPVPTKNPTSIPTQNPIDVPTQVPTQTQRPTIDPTKKPVNPTQEPVDPTQEPIMVPTQKPTTVPTQKPTEIPTQVPTEKPTQNPTAVPTQKPTPEPIIDDSSYLNENWEYSISQKNNIITLIKYKGVYEDVEISGSYKIGTQTYTTNLKASTVNEGPFVKNSIIKTVTFADDFKFSDDVSYLFYQCNNLETVDGFEYGTFTTMDGSFAYCTEFNGLDIIPENVISAANAFAYCEKLVTIPTFNKVLKNANGMFKYCSNLSKTKKINIGGQNILILPENLESMNNMFDNCINLDFHEGNIPDTVKTAAYAFYNCKLLKYMPSISENSELTNMSNMFACCENLCKGSIVIGNKVQNVDHLFYYCCNFCSYQGDDVKIIWHIPFTRINEVNLLYNFGKWNNGHSGGYGHTTVTFIVDNENEAALWRKYIDSISDYNNDNRTFFAPQFVIKY